MFTRLPCRGDGSEQGSAADIDICHFVNLKEWHNYSQGVFYVSAPLFLFFLSHSLMVSQPGPAWQPDKESCCDHTLEKEKKINKVGQYYGRLCFYFIEMCQSESILLQDTSSELFIIYLLNELER